MKFEKSKNELDPYVLESTKMQHVLRFIQFSVAYNRSDTIFGSKQAIRVFYVNESLERSHVRSKLKITIFDQNFDQIKIFGQN